MVEPLIDFAILTAKEVERRAVCEAFQITDQDRVFKDTRTYWRKCLSLNDREFYEIVVAQSPDMANVDATLLSVDALRHWEPGAMLLVGIAGAASEEQRLGDLVIGSWIYYYERGKLTPDGMELEPYMAQADPVLWNRVKTIPDWESSIPVARPDGEQARPKIHYGVIASGEKVISDAVVRDQILAGQRKIKAVEMEGYGFSAAISQNFNQVRHLVIKAISDLADFSKNDEWHSCAAAVAAGFTKHFLSDKPLKQRNPPIDKRVDGNTIDLRYHSIIDNFKIGNIVPFIGAGINPNFFINLASFLTKDIREELQPQGKWNSIDESESNKELIKKLVGEPCAVCHYLLKNRPEDCLIREGIETDCPLYKEQELAIVQTTLRCLLSEYLKPKQALVYFYNKLRTHIASSKSSDSKEIYRFIAQEFPSLMASRGYPQHSPGLPYQLIVTTNYDNSLEQAFENAEQPFDVVFYVADGQHLGKFKHKPFGGETRLIESQDYRDFSLCKPWGNSNIKKPIILKIFGSEDDFFAITKTQLNYLVDSGIQNLPTVLTRIIGDSAVLFLGYSIQDFDIQIIRNIFARVLEPYLPYQMWIINQSQPGEIDKKMWKNSESILTSSSIEELFVNLRKGFK